MAPPIFGVAAVTFLLINEVFDRNLSTQSVLIGGSLILLFTFFSLNVWNESSVKLEKNGISKRTLLGRKYLAFEEVTDLKSEYLFGTLWKVLLRSEDQEFVVNALYYREPEKLLQLFKRGLQSGIR